MIAFPVTKFNPYHDKTGRFAAKPGGEVGPFEDFGSLRDFNQQYSVHQRLYDVWGGWRKSTTPREKEAVDEYAGNAAYKVINDSLRSGGDGGRLSRTVDLIDSALAKSSAPGDVVVYRGISKRVAKMLGDASEGSLIIDRGFVSTSVSSGVSDRYTGKRGTTVAIEVPYGSRAGYADALNWSVEHMREMEVLLPRNSVFRVKKSDGGRIVLEYVGTGIE